MEIVDLTLFRDVNLQECARMINCLDAHEKSYNSGDVILDFSKESSSVGIIVTGVARMERIDPDGSITLLESLPEDSIFGETIAFSDSSGDMQYVIAEKKTRVLFINYEHITKRCQNACPCHAKLIENLLYLISVKMSLLSERIEIITRRSIREKLLCFFIMLSHKTHSKSVALPFSMSDLAEYICADRSATSRELSKMRQDGLLTVNNHKYTLCV